MTLSTHDTMDTWACSRTPEAAPALARLLQEEAPPDDRNDFGVTPLHVAASRGNDEAVELLLHHGADILAADWESGWTPLHRSIYNQHLSTSLILLRHAQTRFGKKFMRKYLHETRDHAEQSPMELLSAMHPPRHGDRQNDADDGLVYTFGKRDYQLGYHLPNADMQVSPRLVGLPDRSPVIQLSASKYHTIALNANGECYVWGFGKGGRLGTGSEFDRIEPTRLTSLETTPMIKVAAGENHTLALSRTGQVFSWGSNSFGQLGHPGKSTPSQRLTPKRVDAFRFQEIEDIAASGCHSAAIDNENGTVYTWGSNRRGQLGRKEGCGTDQADAVPRSVDALQLRHPLSVVYGDYESARVTQLALSDWNTCVVLRCTQNGRSVGQVWQFGYGSYRPSRVNLPADKITSGAGAVMCNTWVPTCKQRGVDVVQISCAQNHSIALSAAGSVYTWGHNVPALSHQQSASSPGLRRGALSTNASQSPSAPQKVRLSNHGPVTSVCASQDHCAVVTQNGDLVTWGCGQQGVLGHGRGNTWQPNPKRVEGVKKAISVAAGHQHTAVLISPASPEFLSYTQNAVPSLLELVEREISTHVNVANCAVVWKYAELYAAMRLQAFCLDYLRWNWDAVLETVGRDRMDTLFEIMLPPLDEPEPEEKARAVVPARTDKLAKQKKARKQLSVSQDAGKSEFSVIAAVLQEGGLTEGDGLNTKSRVDIHSEKSRHAALVKSSQVRKSKNTKFVSWKSFMSDNPSAASIRGISSPWSSATTRETKYAPTMDKSAPHTGYGNSSVATIDLPGAFPLPSATSVRKESLDGTSRIQRKTSIGSQPSTSPRPSFSPLPTTGKQMLGYDGLEHEQVASFSLDAFIKQPSRGRGRNKKESPPTLTWNNFAMDTADDIEQKPRPKTLKEIQEEEEAAAAREREAKARLSGTTPAERSQFTVNSWGLFRTPDHVSLAEVQKLQEEQEFLEQQRQILAEIEREQSERTRAAAIRSTRSNASKEASAGSRRGRNTRKVRSGNSSAVTDAHAGSGSQAKQKKKKNAKERKAARKAAGETFAESSTPATPSATNGETTHPHRSAQNSRENNVVETKPKSKWRSSRKKNNQAGRD